MVSEPVRLQRKHVMLLILLNYIILYKLVHNLQTASIHKPLCTQYNAYFLVELNRNEQLQILTE